MNFNQLKKGQKVFGRDGECSEIILTYSVGKEDYVITSDCEDEASSFRWFSRTYFESIEYAKQYEASREAEKKSLIKEIYAMEVLMNEKMKKLDDEYGESYYTTDLVQGEKSSMSNFKSLKEISQRLGIPKEAFEYFARPSSPDYYTNARKNILKSIGITEND